MLGPTKSPQEKFSWQSIPLRKTWVGVGGAWECWSWPQLCRWTTSRWWRRDGGCGRGCRRGRRRCAQCTSRQESVDLAAMVLETGGRVEICDLSCRLLWMERRRIEWDLEIFFAGLQEAKNRWVGRGKERPDQPNVHMEWVNADHILLYDVTLWPPVFKKQFDTAEY
jgi:hypothetical protein